MGKAMGARALRRERLIRRTFELYCDVEYHAFREVFVEAHALVSRYPDPLARERHLRGFWNRHMEPAYEQFRAPRPSCPWWCWRAITGCSRRRGGGRG